MLIRLLGFYIHTCSKMRYKRDLKTQQVLGKRSLDIVKRALSK